MANKFRSSVSLVVDITADTAAEAKEEVNSLIKKMVEAFPQISKTGYSLNVVRESDCCQRSLIKDFPPDEVLSKIRKDGERVSFEVGEKVYRLKMNSPRYHLFAKNKSCVACGLEGTIMTLEQPASCPDDSMPHFNLYGIENGERILLTKDHKVPQSKGGKNQLSNYQTMCSICNNLKAHYFLSPEDVKALRAIWNKYKNSPADLNLYIDLERQDREKRGGLNEK